MLTIYTGEYKSIKQTIADKAAELKLPIVYSTNIINDIRFSSGLFFKPSILYFLYSPELFPDKETIEGFITIANNSKLHVICVYENVDKRSVFYKSCKNMVHEIHNNNNSSIPVGVSKKEYSAYLSKIQKPVEYDYKNIGSLIRNNKLEEIAFAPTEQIVSILYTVYYASDKYKLLAGNAINEILQGKLTPQNAIKYFLLYKG